MLVIDVHPRARRAIMEMLTPAGHELLEAQDGRDGLRLFRAHRPAVVVTAIVMPDMDGLEVIRELRRDPCRVAIIAVSDDPPPRGALYLSLAKMMGADEVMAKPLSALCLVEAVGRLASLG